MLKKNSLQVLCVRLRECRNVRIVGSLLFCDYCETIIGYVNVDGACVLKDVRLLFFVPIDSVASADEQVVLFRILERGPMKRRCVTDDLSDEPPFKKLKFDKTRSVIVDACSR